MSPEYAFIMPNKWTSEQIAWFHGATHKMRPDQIKRVWHLAHSWGVTEGIYARDFFRLMRRAVKNTLNNLP